MAAEITGKPRASGDDPPLPQAPVFEYKVNPARAGMIRHAAGLTEPPPRKPRASGDDPRGIWQTEIQYK